MTAYFKLRRKKAPRKSLTTIYARIDRRYRDLRKWPVYRHQAYSGTLPFKLWRRRVHAYWSWTYLPQIASSITIIKNRNWSAREWGMKNE